MSNEEILASGILELYVSGSLSEEEVTELELRIAEDPRLQQEVEAIEASLITLAKSVSPTLSALVWTYIRNAISNVRTLDTERGSTNWSAISGWAAAILAIAGIFWMINQNTSLKEDIEITTTENTLLKEKVQSTETTLASTTEILDVLRSKDYTSITLPGNQAVAPNAFAKVYFNKDAQVAYIDSRGLPEAPETNVYQVWSLKLDPLTPTSMGLLDAATEVENGIYKFENVPDPEAFGITLEPAGGSATPTLTQLYTLGAVSP